MLHEILHIRLSPAEVCQDGCQDEWVGVKDTSVRAYRAGPSKLLARVSARRAAENNDNYVYFAMAKYMEKTFKYPPEYPRAWDPKKTKADNQNREAREPGVVSEVEPFDELAASSEESDTTDGLLVEASRYPEWYRPIITAGTTDEDLPPIEEPPGNSQPASGPTSFDDVTCEVDHGSPEIADCVHAFGSLVGVPDVPAEHNKKGETWWSGMSPISEDVDCPPCIDETDYAFQYVHSCALAVSYTEDWTDDCQASYSDVQGHASAIFEKCQDGGRGKVGGKVVFNVPNCPAEVKIMHT